MTGFEIIAYFLLLVYTLAMIYITIFCLMQLNLLYQYLRKDYKNSVANGSSPHPISQLPFITIQLPIYNEKYVVERLIDNIMLLDYPKDKFEVQVLDDSTDRTSDIVIKKVNDYLLRGFNIQALQRKDRTGFKAGALKEGMKIA
ncbi:MAG: glycosyltransferase, partial [Saprospiraceae bacterium]